MLDPRPERRPSAAALVGGPAGTAVRGPLVATAATVARVGRRPGGVGASALLVGVVVAARETGDAPPATATPTTTTDCAALPYQPCGAGRPAPGTDGRACLPGVRGLRRGRRQRLRGGRDGLVDGTDFPEGAPAMSGTIVPRDDVDTFAMEVGDGYQLLCDGRFTVTLTAPVGVTMRLEVLDGDDVAGPDHQRRRRSRPASRLDDPDCLFVDARALTARVSPIGTDRTGGDLPAGARRLLLTDSRRHGPD